MSEESLVLGLGEKCRTLKYFKVRGEGRATEQKCNMLPKRRSCVIYYLQHAILVGNIFQTNKGYRALLIWIRQYRKGRCSLSFPTSPFSGCREFRAPTGRGFQGGGFSSPHGQQKVSDLKIFLEHPVGVGSVGWLQKANTHLSAAHK